MTKMETQELQEKSNDMDALAKHVKDFLLKYNDPKELATAIRCGLWRVAIRKGEIEIFQWDSWVTETAIKIVKELL